MPFALAMLFVLFLAATASAQSVLDDKGRVYPCVPSGESNCAFPSARTPLQPWPFDPLRYRKQIPAPPFLGATPAGSLYPSAIDRARTAIRPLGHQELERAETRWFTPAEAFSAGTATSVAQDTSGVATC